MVLITHFTLYKVSLNYIKYSFKIDRYAFSIFKTYKVNKIYKVFGKFFSFKVELKRKVNFE